MIRSMISPVGIPSAATIWPYDTNFDDSVGVLNGVAIGTPVAGNTDRKVGAGSLLLNGIDSGVALNFPEMKVAFTNLSISAWFKATTVIGEQNIAETGGASSGMTIRLNGSTLEARVVSTDPIVNTSGVSVVGLSANQWYFMVVTFANGELKLYLDAVLVDTDDHAIYILGSHNNPAGIGYRNTADSYGSGGDASFFGGRIDDVRVFRETVLTLAQIVELSKVT